MTDTILPTTIAEDAQRSDADYQAVVHIAAPPQAVFDALTTITGLGSWWGPVSGLGVEGGELRFVFHNAVVVLVHVEAARRPSVVRWLVRECNAFPDWAGTVPRFELTPSESGGCDLRFRHHGLSAQLECYEMCRAGWDEYLASLRNLVETGKGNPSA